MQKKCDVNALRDAIERLAVRHVDNVCLPCIVSELILEAVCLIGMIDDEKERDRLIAFMHTAIDSQMELVLIGLDGELSGPH